MRSETVKHIVKYYGEIPEAIKLLKRERDALEDEYNGLGGLAMDGMPHSSAPGNPTEALAVRVIENGVKNRLQEIGVQVAVLEGDAANIRGALDAVNGKYKSVIFKSITFDNGTEFAAAEELERSCVNKHLPRTKVYFCHPYSSWERGTNENTNGMIRRRFPKGTNFAAVTNAQIVQAENWINNYPRKILGYKSSEIVFRECLRELGIAA